MSGRTRPRGSSKLRKFALAAGLFAVASGAVSGGGVVAGAASGIAATPPAAATIAADRPIVSCPVRQSPVKNGARPKAALLAKIVQCSKGEKAASPGYDGAVTIDVTALQIGARRPWKYSQDTGSGQKGTFVYPVKVTYTEKTFYWTRTAVSENWVRIINFYVDSFGEWTNGSEESIKRGDLRDIPV